MPKFIIAITTTNSKKSAEELANIILNKKLAACIHIYKIDSFYWWQDKITKDNEFVLHIKTTDKLYKQLEQVIVKNHPYDMPEIIQVPISQGYKPYLDWIVEQTENG